METWDNPYNLHEHAIDMLVRIYDHKNVNAYNTSIYTYINGDQAYSSAPIILLSIPDPALGPLNTVRKDFRPNPDFNNMTNIRPDDYLAIT